MSVESERADMRCFIICDMHSKANSRSFILNVKNSWRLAVWHFMTHGAAEACEEWNQNKNNGDDGIETRPRVILQRVVRPRGGRWDRSRQVLVRERGAWVILRCIRSSEKGQGNVTQNVFLVFFWLPTTYQGSSSLLSRGTKRENMSRVSIFFLYWSQKSNALRRQEVWCWNRSPARRSEGSHDERAYNRYLLRTKFAFDALTLRWEARALIMSTDLRGIVNRMRSEIAAMGHSDNSLLNDLWYRTAPLDQKSMVQIIV